MKSHLKSWWMSSKSRAIDWWGAILLAEWTWFTAVLSLIGQFVILSSPIGCLAPIGCLVWGEWLQQTSPAWDWIVTRGCCWLVQLTSSGPDPDTRHCTQHSQMSTAATTGSEFGAICGICPPSIPRLKFWTSENKWLISRFKMIRWTWEVLLIYLINNND